MQDEHMQRNWGDIGFHFLVDRWGRILAGRSLRYVGAHVNGHNRSNVGICLLMDGDHEELSVRAFDAVTDLVAWLCLTYVILPFDFGPHCRYTATGCPGRHVLRQFPVLQESVGRLVERWS